MGNLNFQDEENTSEESSRQDRSDADSEKSFTKPAPDNSKVLWITLLVVIIAIIAGGVYFVNKKGLLNPTRKLTTGAAVEAPVSQPAPPLSSPGSNVSEIPESASTAKANTATTAQRFVVQISSFKSEGFARKYLNKIKSKGIRGYVVKGKVGKTTWYRVWVGPFENEAKAILASSELRKKVGTNVWVVPEE